MVFDTVADCSKYAGLSKGIALAFDHLQRRLGELTAMPTGRHTIDGSDVYVMISDYETKPETLGMWEAHRKYIDLQYMISGIERIGVAPIGRMKPGVYSDEKDFFPVFGTGDFLTLGRGDFMLIWPGDAHMPGIAVGGKSATVRKAVYKIRVPSGT